MLQVILLIGSAGEVAAPAENDDEDDWEGQVSFQWRTNPCCDVNNRITKIQDEEDEHEDGEDEDEDEDGEDEDEDEDGEEEDEDEDEDENEETDLELADFKMSISQAPGTTVLNPNRPQLRGSQCDTLGSDCGGSIGVSIAVSPRRDILDDSAAACPRAARRERAPRQECAAPRQKFAAL
jgi:hypothetical protein